MQQALIKGTSFSNIMKQYNKFAEKFKVLNEHFLTLYPKIRYSLYDLVNHSKLEGMKILDLGCGYGKDLAYFRDKGAEVYGIDLSKEMLALASEEVPEATLTRGDFKQLPYENDFFDIIISRYAIQHSEHVSQVFEEAYRALKPGGELIFNVTHPFRQLIEKKTRDYWKKEEILCSIFSGQLTVYEPSHTFSDYISPFMLKHFELKEFHELEDPGAKQFKGFQKYPRILLIKYKKSSLAHKKI